MYIYAPFCVFAYSRAPFVRFFATKKPNLSTGQIRLFLSDAFLSERDAHCVRDPGFACGARLRRVCGTHRITYHSEAATLITYLQNKLIRGIILRKRGVYYARIKASGAFYGLHR